MLEQVHFYVQHMFRNLLIFGLSTSKPNLRLGHAMVISLKKIPSQFTHKNELSIIIVYKTWLCITGWGISAWNLSKMKQRWRKDFCTLLFIVTKIVCKKLRICGYPEGEKTSSVDWSSFSFLFPWYCFHSTSPFIIKVIHQTDYTIQARGWLWVGHYRGLGT